VGRSCRVLQMCEDVRVRVLEGEDGLGQVDGFGAGCPALQGPAVKPQAEAQDGSYTVRGSPLPNPLLRLSGARKCAMLM